MRLVEVCDAICSSLLSFAIVWKVNHLSRTKANQQRRCQFWGLGFLYGTILTGTGISQDPRYELIITTVFRRGSRQLVIKTLLSVEYSAVKNVIPEQRL